jgi:hypothetical protein
MTIQAVTVGGEVRLACTPFWARGAKGRKGEVYLVHTVTA